ncbi:ribose-phosphate diphosphokinase [Marinomonas transparens]|uniref:Ribose-phosphate pyrophosphokinase n=1 Tax=Marinomonas transparens TaxID=2795388 RepID=A0A934JS67_9GAMM|nr:ribose-phosphate diphosphokinase [Marinomonas transparens]MBJ7539728.1 ribose-phosphate pyrophosphokinase [Marinomonas transparens]
MSITITTNLNDTIQLVTLGFSGGERHVQLSYLPTDTPKFVSIKAILNSTDDLLDLLLIDNALENHYGQQVKLRLEIPYLPYARQDRVCAEGQAFSLQLMAKLIKNLNIEELAVWDCHSNVGLELTGATNVPATEIIKSDSRLSDLLRSPKAVLVCPDKGALQRCSELKEELNISNMVICEKQRNPTTGKITHTDVLTDDLTGKVAIITDDICDGGYTFIKIAEQLKAKNAEKVVLYVTHGIFSKGLSVFEGLIDEIYTTTSFTHQPSDKLHVIDYTYKSNNLITTNTKGA